MGNLVHAKIYYYSINSSLITYPLGSYLSLDSYLFSVTSLHLPNQN